MNMDKHEGWIVSLSNGETLFEGKPVDGERTPWQKALQYCRDNKLEITMLRMRRNGMTFMAMPHKMCNGYFHAYEARKKFFASMGEHGEVGTLSQGIGSVIDDKVYIQWTSIGAVVPTTTQDMRDLDSSRIHTTLQ